MRIEERGMYRREFKRITSSSLRWKEIDTGVFTGYAGILDIIDTSEIWKVSSLGDSTIIAAPGYKWLQLSPHDASWWLTVMYDTEGALVQYYFDIIGNRWLSEAGEPRFCDMFADVVMLPDGKYCVLDREELEIETLAKKQNEEQGNGDEEQGDGEDEDELQAESEESSEAEAEDEDMGMGIMM